MLLIVTLFSVRNWEVLIGIVALHQQTTPYEKDFNHRRNRNHLRL
jgi:hypothetical protein